MPRRSLSGALLLGGICLALAGGCGKKAPLRLPDDRPAESAPSVRARVRENRVSLDFRVPSRRVFPEREEPWVLARILRQGAPAAEVVEVGAILRRDGFTFDSPLTWTDEALPANKAYLYRVEFRDALRRRRAVSEPLKVSWDRLPPAPARLAAAGRLRTVVLTWTAAGGAERGHGYRVYRREPPHGALESLTPAAVTDGGFVDSRVEAGRTYCYEVRAVLDAGGIEIEGAPSPEECARAAADELPPSRPPSGPP